MSRCAEVAPVIVAVTVALVLVSLQSPHAIWVGATLAVPITGGEAGDVLGGGEVLEAEVVTGVGGGEVLEADVVTGVDGDAVGV